MTAQLPGRPVYTSLQAGCVNAWLEDVVHAGKVHVVEVAGLLMVCYGMLWYVMECYGMLWYDIV